MPGSIDYVEGEIIVKFRSGTGGVAAADAVAAVGASVKNAFGAVPGMRLLEIGKGASVEAAVAVFEAMPQVEYAQPNYCVQEAIAAIPGDTLFSDLWALDNTGQTGGVSDADVDATEAWDIVTGSSGTVVAVLDTGIDYEHPDLIGNMWHNIGEIPGDCVDNDGNGYVDDIYGYDVVNGDGDPWDDHGHGTHCAGTIGAVGDNDLGVSGVNWDVSIMSVKVASASGSITTADVLEAIAYVDAMAVDICSCSWGGVGWNDAAVRDALAASEALYVFAAGNDGINTDATPYYPAGYNLPNVMAVGASDNGDNAASFSNYGATSVDVFAPGTDIESTVPGWLAGSYIPEDARWSDDFTSLTNWVNALPGSLWALTTTSARSAPSALARLNYSDNEASYVDCSIPLDLSGTTDPQLLFWVNCNLEYDGDFLVVGIYDRSDNEYRYLEHQYTGSTGGSYVQCIEDLSAYAGEDDIFLWFGLESNGSASGTGYYVRVDDVVVNATMPTDIDYTSAYEAWDGTSMATPHVAGIAALLRTYNPSLSAAQMRLRIMGAADEKSSLASRCVMSARANAHTALVAANVRPVAAADSYSMVPNTVLAVPAAGVLVNDADADGDTLTVVKVTDPAHGTVALNVSGSFVYTPTAGWSGVDSFTYQANDGGRTSNIAKVSITVNDAPVAVPDAYAAIQSTALTIAAPGVLSNDTDLNGDALVAVKVVSPAHGTVTLSANGSFTYVPIPGWSGKDSFTYAAGDGMALSNAATVTITVAPAVTIEDKAAGVTFDRFVPSVSSAYSDGTYIYGRWTGTRIESRFTGTKIAWWGPKQPGYGKADVYVDGVYKATVDCYAAAGKATLSAKIWESATLSPGSHTLSIRLTGARNAASTGNVVVIDKFVASGTGASNPQSRVNESAGTFTGSWVTCSSGTYTGGTYRYSRWAGARLRYTFTGTKIAWIGPRALNYGRAEVWIDGVKKATVSQYGALGWRYRVWESSTLTAGRHTIEIRVLGTKEAASSNTIVVVDGFDVKP